MGTDGKTFNPFMVRGTTNSVRLGAFGWLYYRGLSIAQYYRDIHTHAVAHTTFTCSGLLFRYIDLLTEI